MGRTRQHKKETQDVHTHLAISVEWYDARVEAGVNHNVYTPQYAWNLDDDDPLFQFTSELSIAGRSTYPEDRAEDAYELTIYGDDAPSRNFNATLKNAQARDEHGIPRYRKYRGREIPLYDPPEGLGLLKKARGESRWTAWLHATPRFVNDALVLLSLRKSVFLAIHEHKRDRTRWIRSVTIQTTDPAEE